MIVRAHGNGRGDSRVAAETPPARAEAGFVGLHCHCLPNLDDGPDSSDGPVTLCRALARDHLCTVVATPHQLGEFETRVSAGKIRQTAQSSDRELLSRGIDLKVRPGAEVRRAERLVSPRSWGREEVG